MQIKVKNPTGNRIDNPGKVLLFILNDGTLWSNSRTPFTEKNLPAIGAAGAMVTVMFDRAYDVRANVGSEIEFLSVRPFPILLPEIKF